MRESDLYTAQQFAHLPCGDEPNTRPARHFSPAIIEAEAERPPGQVLLRLGR